MRRRRKCPTSTRSCKAKTLNVEPSTSAPQPKQAIFFTRSTQKNPMTSRIRQSFSAPCRSVEDASILLLELIPRATTSSTKMLACSFCVASQRKTWTSAYVIMFGALTVVAFVFFPGVQRKQKETLAAIRTSSQHVGGPCLFRDLF